MWDAGRNKYDWKLITKIELPNDRGYDDKWHQMTEDIEPLVGSLWEQASVVCTIDSFHSEQNLKTKRKRGREWMVVDAYSYPTLSRLIRD